MSKEYDKAFSEIIDNEGAYDMQPDEAFSKGWVAACDIILSKLKSIKFKTESDRYADKEDVVNYYEAVREIKKL